MGKEWVKVISYSCERCNHVWVPRLSFEELREGKITTMPVICPKCKSPYWNRPKKILR
jgi:hypothetical protein